MILELVTVSCEWKTLILGNIFITVMLEKIGYSNRCDKVTSFNQLIRKVCKKRYDRLLNWE